MWHATGKISNAAEIRTGACGFDLALPANLASVVPSVGGKLCAKVHGQMALRASITAYESQGLDKNWKKIGAPLEA